MAGARECVRGRLSLLCESRTRPHSHTVCESRTLSQATRVMREHEAHTRVQRPACVCALTSRSLHSVPFSAFLASAALAASSPAQRLAGASAAVCGMPHGCDWPAPRRVSSARRSDRGQRNSLGLNAKPGAPARAGASCAVKKGHDWRALALTQ